MIMELQHRRTAAVPSSSSRDRSRQTRITTTTTSGQSSKNRRRKRTSEASKIVGTRKNALVLVVAITIVPLVVWIARRGWNSYKALTATFSSSSTVRALQKLQSKQHKTAAIQPANIPSLDDLEAEERANQRDALYESLYRLKFDASALGYDIYNCPEYPTSDYPRAWRATDVLSNWNPNDVVTTPSNPRNIYQGLCVFNYQTQYATALQYRKLEKPFIIRKDPLVTSTARKWADDPEYLHRIFGDVKEYRTERSPSNQFMYYRIRGNRQPENYKPPPNDEIEMTFGEWLEYALEKDGVALRDADIMAKSNLLREKRMMHLKMHPQHHNNDEDNRKDDALQDDKPKEEEDEDADVEQDNEKSKEDKYYYFRMNASLQSDKKESKFIYNELPFFDPRKRKESQFYIVEPREERGINCRFGMRGITAANHFDMSRNTIAIFGGERRYILAAPNQCKNMALYPKNHPSLRHSSFDWSNPEEWEDHPEFKNALVHEVVLHEGDVLYLPTNWFHFIVNLSLNYQCNARSGTTFESSDVINDCGFNMPSA